MITNSLDPDDFDKWFDTDDNKRLETCPACKELNVTYMWLLKLDINVKTSLDPLLVFYVYSTQLFFINNVTQDVT